VASPSRTFAAIALVLAAATAARAQESKPPAPDGPAPAPPQAPAKSPDAEPEEPPYTEGWRGGSPPGEHVTFRLMLWSVEHATALEFSNNLRTGAVTSHELGQPSHELAAGLGVEVAGGKTGWYSLDYWQLASRGSRDLPAPITVDDRTFPSGETVTSETTQHYAKLRDALDIRYRLPLGPEQCWLDFNFGPVLGLGARYEVLEVASLTLPLKDASHFFALTVIGGVRLGLDLHVSDAVTVRLGADLDSIPWSGKRRFSFTRSPSISKWRDYRVFLAFRFMFVEAQVGYRYFLSEASGSNVRQADANMQGGDFQLAFRF
jgi:hypothetical protein